MESKRKCFKCGCSPAEDNVKLFRFPKPGLTNLTRCSMWAKYIFPEKEYESVSFQKQLHSEHRMLCQRHFKDSAFADDAKTKLLRSAFPCDEEPALRTYSSGRLSQRPLCDVTNIEVIPQHIEAAPIQQPKDMELAGPSTARDIRENIHIQPAATPMTVQAEQTKETILFKKCRKYLQKICQLQNRIKNQKQKKMLDAINDDIAIQKLSQKITPAFALLLQGQIRNFNKKKTGRRWSREEKIIALRIYKRSPTCYRLLQRMFPLPSTSTLKSLLRRLPFEVGVNQQIFKVLKKFVQKQDQRDNNYILMFDEMSLKKHLQYNPKNDTIEGFQDHGMQGRVAVPATYALVFMIAGIRKKFKQPVAHYFSSGFSTADRLAVLIKEVLYQCFEAGINITATVCDMDGVNRRALQILGSTVQHPYIHVHNKEIVTFYDTPHLLKCFRNLFMKYNIETITNISSEGKVGKGVAKWSHIKKFYEVDSTNPNFVYAPVLKREHLDPNTKQKMKVCLAAQVLSHSVAGGMFSRISKGYLEAEATVTAELVADMDKLFDLMNADCNDLRRGKPHSTNWTRTSPHTEFLQKMKSFFENIKFIGSPRRPPSQDGWVTTINAFLHMRKRFESENIFSLATRRFQQDPLENLFGCIRGNCGSNTNPTCGQFVAGLKTAILGNLANIGTKGNCETDNNEVINNFNTFLSVSQSQATSASTYISTGSVENLPEIREDDIQENDAEIQACAYVCGFIVKNNKNNKCHICQKIFLADDIEPHHLFVQNREYEEQKRSLTYVTRDMTTCVESCATVVNKILEENGHEKALKQKIKETLKNNINFAFLEKCQEHEQANKEHILNSIFEICVKRFCVIKNRNFSKEASAAALKRKMKIIVHS